MEDWWREMAQGWALIDGQAKKSAVNWLQVRQEKINESNFKAGTHKDLPLAFHLFISLFSWCLKHFFPLLSTPTTFKYLEKG